MKISSLSFAAVTPLFLACFSTAFQTSSLAKTRFLSPIVRYAYIPDGFTAESYKKFKANETKKNVKNLGGVGPRGFKSRSMQSFQEAMEKGEATHLMPVFNAKEKVRSGKLVSL